MESGCNQPEVKTVFPVSQKRKNGYSLLECRVNGARMYSRTEAYKSPKSITGSEEKEQDKRSTRTAQ
jgi:hypothetical protein